MSTATFRQGNPSAHMKKGTYEKGRLVLRQLYFEGKIPTGFSPHLFPDRVLEKTMKESGQLVLIRSSYMLPQDIPGHFLDGKCEFPANPLEISILLNLLRGKYS